MSDRLRAILLTDRVEAHVKFDDGESRLTLNDMLSAPFRIVRRPIGVVIARFPDMLCELFVRAMDFEAELKLLQHAPNMPPIETSAPPPPLQIPPARKQRRDEFKKWLMDQMTSDQWRPKKDFESIAKSEFEISTTSFRRIWPLAIEEAGKANWTKPGRR